MDAQIWVICQIIIDIIIVALLLWLGKLHLKRRMPWQSFEAAIRKSETVLSEMKQIGLVLEKNLEEKKDLSRYILEQLDQGLKRAEERYQQICKIIQKPGEGLADQSVPLKDTTHTLSSINALLGKGFPKEEIAQHLGISVGEIELLLKLQPSNDRSKLRRSEV
ncbi:MAG: hypothetical protein JRJ02_04730 [Deltaproteobacteria bacterium]|nr:hypothetical protein [Deltaproteobacteria bacterium]